MQKRENPDNQSYEEEAREAPAEPAKKKRFFGRCREKIALWKKSFKEAVNERAGEIAHAKKKRVTAIVCLCVIAVFFVAFYLAVGKKIAFFIRDADGFREWLDGFGAGSVVVFILLRVVQTVLKLIPGEALEIAAGCAFGVWGGLLWCLVGSVIGSLIIIFLGKKYGMKIVGLFVSPKKMQSVSFLKDKKRLNFVFFLLYFIPGTPKDMFTWLVCLTDENVFWFLLITSVARIPSIVTSTWCGHELVNENYLLSVLILAVTIVLGIIGGIVFKIVDGRRKKAQEAEAGGSEGGVSGGIQEK